jgi:cytosine/adenosine deaminase-related metal-dependent hydrolase
MRAALQFARLAGGPQALTARQALAAATIDGARCLGRDDELGSLEVGKLADVALWRLDGIDHAGIADPVAALVLGAPPPLELLLVQGRPVVERGHVLTVDADKAAADAAAASRRLLTRGGVHR